MKVCLIEDDYMLAKAIEKFCEIQHYDFEYFYDGEKAFDNIHVNNDYDIYLLDLNLPKINGLDILKKIRECHTNVPVIVITAETNIQSLELAFGLGCNEYIKKPFNLRELDIRINKSMEKKISKFHINNIAYFDFESKSLFVNNKEISLRKKEIRALEILIKNFNFIVTNEILQDYIWEGDPKESYPLRQLINTLRGKIPFEIIKTYIGTGYKATNEL